MGSMARWMIQSVSRLVLETPLRSVVGCGETPSIKHSVGENNEQSQYAIISLQHYHDDLYQGCSFGGSDFL